MVLPLPLNAVEQYMLADDSADYPRYFLLIVRLHESLDVVRLQSAIEAATKRHPLLRALVEYDADRPRRWIECSNPRYEVHGIDDPTAAAGEGNWQSREFDLRREPGVRFHVGRDDAGDALYVEFHHACTDGLGALQFVGELLTLYAAGVRDAETKLPTLNADRLATRDAFGLTGWRRPLRWLYGSLGWLAAIEFLLHRPAPLGHVPAVGGTGAFGNSRLCSQTLTVQQTSAVLQAAKRQYVTVNDLVIRDTFLALQETIERHWPDRAKAHKRIMVPTNLRATGDDRLPAANVVAMINVDRRPHRWTNANQLLRVLHWELTIVKQMRLGVIFVQILHTLQTAFGSLQRFLPRDRCQATCVVSNLGQVFVDFEPSLIRAVEFFPPIRPLTAVAFGVLTYGAQMTISIHYDATALTSMQAVEILEGLAVKLRHYEMAETELLAEPAAISAISVEPVCADFPS